MPLIKRKNTAPLTAVLDATAVTESLRSENEKIVAGDFRTAAIQAEKAAADAQRKSAAAAAASKLLIDAGFETR